MYVLSGACTFGARPKRHLASIIPVENITFDTGRGLIRARDSVSYLLNPVHFLTEAVDHGIKTEGLL